MTVTKYLFPIQRLIIHAISYSKTINSRVNRMTKLATNKVTKKDVPRLVSLTVDTRHSQKPKLYVGDAVRIVKKKKLSEKDTSSRSLTKFLKLPVFRRWWITTYIFSY